ncbi:hypothetical protein [Clostridium sp. DL1XJH146]
MNKWNLKISLFIIIILLGLLVFQHQKYIAEKGNLDTITLVEIQLTLESIVYEYEKETLTPERFEVYQGKLITLSRFCGESDNLNELQIYLDRIITFDDLDDKIILQFTNIEEKLNEFNQLVYSVNRNEHGGRAYRLLKNKDVRENIIDSFTFVNNH